MNKWWENRPEQIAKELGMDDPRWNDRDEDGVAYWEKPEFKEGVKDPGAVLEIRFTADEWKRLCAINSIVEGDRPHYGMIAMVHDIIITGIMAVEDRQ